jgi:hypothetical protein
MIHWCVQVAYNQHSKAVAEGRMADAAWHLDWSERLVADPSCAVSYFYFSGNDLIYPARQHPEWQGEA